jgi:chromosomal replication initiation ATPase DnaA
MSDRIIIRKQDCIDYILTGVCNFYQINKQELLARARSPYKTKRKLFTVKILRDVADLQFKDIMYALDVTSQAGIWLNYSSITDDLSCDKLLKAEYNDLLKYLNV